uniref:hypothetical protein n=1 Tax=Nonomuraea sp. CA-251285 TaxID=3240002 RepID=UPI003F490BCB
MQHSPIGTIFTRQYSVTGTATAEDLAGMLTRYSPLSPQGERVVTRDHLELWQSLRHITGMPAPVPARPFDPPGPPRWDSTRVLLWFLAWKGWRHTQTRPVALRALVCRPSEAGP